MEITIYNENKAFINETREIILNTMGEQYIFIENLPSNIYPSSISLFSKNIKFFSTEFINNPISTKSMLDASIGNEIELVKYDDDGKISFTTFGKLIANQNKPIFEIDEKIVIDPPYAYRFDNIPDNIKNSPYIHCQIESYDISTKFNLLYLIEGLRWNAEYNLFLNDTKLALLKGAYSITNNSTTSFYDANISLVSGNINFENHKPFTKDAKNQMKLASQTRNLYNAESNMPNYFQTEDYHVFKIPTKITIAPKSQKQYEFLLKKEIPYKKTYHISHSIRRYRKNLSKNETIPINTSIELKAEDIGPFQLPAGSFKIYEKINDALTYIGGEQSTIKQNDDIVKINTGNTRDATCEFFIKSHEINRTHEETEIKAIFTNNKNNDIMLTMTENFYDGGWEIFQTNIEYERIDAYTAKFNLIIPSNSKKEISFKARIEKN
tara:strand:+ start:734 stop:2047 length:1314 start_codon:yes stop_codon:yes gene_type:complete